jgi:hypothetical protein
MEQHHDFGEVDLEFEIIASNLSQEQEDNLREALA